MNIYTGKRLRIEQSMVTLPTGKEREAVIVHPNGAVAILPVDGDSIWLIRQYRYAIGEYIFEVPAGTIESGEDPQETAGRELIEEVGFSARTLIPRGFIYTTPGFTDEKIWLYEAQGLTPSSDYEMDDDEIIEPVRVSLSKVIDMIHRGDIVDAKTICLIFRYIGCT